MELFESWFQAKKKMKGSFQIVDYPEADTAGHDAADRRAVPRYELACSALLRLSERLTFPCALRNVSLSAVQVECDPRYALMIHPMGADVAPAADRRLEISIALPQSGLARGFRARCRVKYCTEAPSRNMLLGLEFVEVEAAAYAQLERLIDALG